MITTTMHFASGDGAGDEDEDRKPLLVSENEGSSGNLQQSTNSHQSTRMTDSLLELRKHAITERLVKDPAQDLIRSRPPIRSSTSPLPPCTRGRRSFSSSQLEIRQCSDRTGNPDTTMLEEIIAGLRGIEGLTKFLKRSKVKSDNIATTMSRKYKDGTNLEWQTWTRPNSDPDLRRAFGASDNLVSKPLKTCLKQKAKNAGTTPPDGTTIFFKGSVEEQSLRRMKTVDFAEAISEGLISVAGHRKQKPIKVSKQASLCPGAAMLSRRSIADPAVTRTDVHAIAIIPTSSKPTGGAQPKQVEDAPVTPTTQIEESRNGSYGVVWDDVPPEHNAYPRRRSFSAGKALEALSTSTGDLERVNAKLTEWSGTSNTSPRYPKPTTVVFPDDGCRPHSEFAVIGNEEIELFAPPNSERVGALHSRYASCPAGDIRTRAPSRDGSSAILFTQDTSLGCQILSAERPYIVPNLKAWPTHLVAARQKLGMPSPERKFSNLKESDIKFRNHRDSVTLAHSRLIHSGALRPELFVHRDSVTMAKKRMHAQLHGASTTRHLNFPETRSKPAYLSDMVVTVPAEPDMEARIAFQKDTSAPILRRPEIAEQRHIRVED